MAARQPDERVAAAADHSDGGTPVVRPGSAERLHGDNPQAPAAATVTRGTRHGARTYPWP